MRSERERHSKSVNSPSDKINMQTRNGAIPAFYPGRGVCVRFAYEKAAVRN